MKNIKDPLPPLESYVDHPDKKPTLNERLRNASLALIFGLVFFHVLFYGSKIFVRVAVGKVFIGSKIHTSLSFLGICTLFGWIKGKDFTR